MFKKEPAVLLGIVAALVAVVVQAVEAGQTGTTFDVWAAALVGLPLLVGVLTRFSVVPVETVKETIDRATTATAAVNDLAARVDAQNPPKA